MAAEGSLASYGMLVAVEGRYMGAAMRVVRVQSLDGMLYLLTALLLSIGFYLGKADGAE